MEEEHTRELYVIDEDRTFGKQLNHIFMRFHFHCISYHVTASHDLPLLVTYIAQPYFQCFVSYETGSQGLFGYTLALSGVTFKRKR